MTKTAANLLKVSSMKMHLYCVACDKPFVRSYPKGYSGGIKVVCSDSCLETLNKESNK